MWNGHIGFLDLGCLEKLNIAAVNLENIGEFEFYLQTDITIKSLPFLKTRSAEE